MQKVILKILRPSALLTVVVSLGPSAQAAQMADGGGKPPMSACVHVIDKAQGIPTGEPRVQQFTTTTYVLRNDCRGHAYNVTLDVALATDPPCRRIGPGKTAKFRWTSSTNVPAAFRDIKECR